jgi:catalase
MRVDGNGGAQPNYSPNSFDYIVEDQSYKQPGLELESTMADWYDRNAQGEDDHYSQPGNLFRILSPEQKVNTIHNIVGAMSGISGPKKDLIINRQLCHWFRADIQLGMGIASGLGLNMENLTEMMPKAH